MSELLAELGPGTVVRPIAIEDPGAGATWSLPVPGESEWRLLAANMMFSTVGGIANRFPHLRLRDQTRELLRVASGEGVPGDIQVTLNWAAGAGAVVGSSAAGMTLAPWPAIPLTPGMTLDWLCTNLGGADGVELITVTVLERYTGEHPPDRRRPLALARPIDLDAKLLP